MNYAINRSLPNQSHWSVWKGQGKDEFYRVIIMIAPDNIGRFGSKEKCLDKIKNVFGKKGEEGKIVGDLWIIDAYSADINKRTENRLRNIGFHVVKDEKVCLVA
ncbi:MAG: hypothetical protein K8T10_20430 [Candidatus Eremiobacteraeota bacterium]|nr:hypothetical protein [Candidatus Eremiobacteraeota bacterium]